MDRWFAISRAASSSKATCAGSALDSISCRRWAALEGAIAFLGFAANDDEVAALSEDDEGIDEIAAYLPIDLEELRGALALEGPSPTDPVSLARITAPTLVRHGSRTSQPWFTASALTVAEQFPNATVREIEGAGHFGHIVDPARDAHLLVPYLEAAFQPA